MQELWVSMTSLGRRSVCVPAGLPDGNRKEKIQGLEIPMDEHFSETEACNKGEG